MPKAKTKPTTRASSKSRKVQTPSRAKRSISPSKSENFVAWVEGHQEKALDHNTWPSVIEEEIRYILELNDQGRTRIREKDYIRRMEDHHGIKTSRHQMYRFLQNRMNRQSWTVAKPVVR